jgi:hypothetical protein
MGLERFDVPNTPGGRTPWVVLILVCAGGVAWAWRALAAAPYAVETASIAAAAAVGVAVYRFGRARFRPGT